MDLPRDEAPHGDEPGSAAEGLDDAGVFSRDAIVGGRELRVSHEEDAIVDRHDDLARVEERAHLGSALDGSLERSGATAQLFGFFETRRGREQLETSEQSIGHRREVAH